MSSNSSEDANWRRCAIVSPRDETDQIRCQLPNCLCRIGGQQLSLEAARALAWRGVTKVPAPARDACADGDLVTFAHDRRAQVSSALYMTEEQISAFFASTTAPMLVVLGTAGLPFPEDRVSCLMPLP